MEIYPLTDRDGRVFAFEIDTAYIGIRQIATLLRAVHGVSDLRIRRLFSLPSDVHIEFCFKGENYIVWEPFADNSRYWIGPKNDDYTQIDIQEIADAFQQYHAPFIIKFFGDMVSFKFLSRIKKKGRK